MSRTMLRYGNVAVAITQLTHIGAVAVATSQDPADQERDGQRRTMARL